MNHTPSIIDPTHLEAVGLENDEASILSHKINEIRRKSPSAAESWRKISKSILTPNIPFSAHLFLFQWHFPHWKTAPDTAPAWIPETTEIANTQLYQLMTALHFEKRHEFHQWSTIQFESFWARMVSLLNIVFDSPFQKIADLSLNDETPRWFQGGTLNIANSCFNAAPDKPAIIYQDEETSSLHTISYRSLDQLSNRVANGLKTIGLKPKEAIAIHMPMTVEAISIYLGIIKMGGVVVSIAESYSVDEVAKRLRIAQAKAIFTQDTMRRKEKLFALYEKVIEAKAPLTIVIPQQAASPSLREKDLTWENFLSSLDTFTPVTSDPMDHINLLFSSGTTADPKAIPWNATTAIKAASDAYLHHNIHAQDRITWPTSLGWMMGPWLIFATFINQATMAICQHDPHSSAFGKFIQDARVTVLGVVPTLVANWRRTQVMEDYDWQTIRAFSSTGECSNPEDMLYLMSRAGYKPIIEYCGGTEIGGAYITSTVIEENYPSLCTTPAFGINIAIINEQGRLSTQGEAVILPPPSLGLSTALLNADHHAVYYANMPKVNGEKTRRHGDMLHQYPSGLYSILGRIDDSMNCGGIKISSHEIEQVLSGMPGLIEVAAVSIDIQGPSLLVLFAVTDQSQNKQTLQSLMQKRINHSLNPLFKIHDVVLISELPKTASNKIMRRVLKNQYILDHPLKK